MASGPRRPGPVQRKSRTAAWLASLGLAWLGLPFSCPFHPFSTLKSSKSILHVRPLKPLRYYKNNRFLALRHVEVFKDKIRYVLKVHQKNIKQRPKNEVKMAPRGLQKIECPRSSWVLVAKRLQDAPKMSPRRAKRPPKTAQEAAKRGPRSPKRPPRRVQEAPRGLQDASKRAQEASKRPQEASRDLQDGSERPQDASRGHQGPPRSIFQ